MNRLIIFLPYLYSIYVVLDFFVANPITLTIWTLTKAILFVLCLAFTLQILLGLVFKNRNIAAIGCFFILLFFYSYRSLETAFVAVTYSRLADSISNILFPLILSTIVIICLLILLRNRTKLDHIALFLSVFSLVLMSMSLFSLLQNQWLSHQVSAYEGAASVNTSLAARELPDIYHISLDGYASQDVLLNNYGLDNSTFIDYLNSNGFIVKNDCLTNYVSTYCSVTSMLTLDYIRPNNIDNRRSSQLLTMRIKQSGVGTILTEYGYNYIEVASPLPTMPSADILGIYRNQANVLSYLLDRTPINHFINSSDFLNSGKTYDYWRKQILDDVDDLISIPQKVIGPTYVFCHPPFVFDSNGEAINPNRPFSLNDCNSYIQAGGTAEEYRTHYADQLVYCNKIIMEILDHIRTNSHRPYVVIISSDHGPRLLIDEQKYENSKFSESLPIFLAYSKPVGDNLDLSMVKSPVNLYRVILNHYFGTNYSLLADYSYYSTWPKPQVFYDITDRIN